MTNRPSEMFSRPEAPCDSAFRKTLHQILDSHAARIESLERDRERQGKLLRAIAEWAMSSSGVGCVPLLDAARAFLADSPPLSPEAKSSSRGVRFTKIVNSDIDIVVYAYDEDGKCW